MPTLVHHKNGFFYLVYCHKGKRIWRSLRTRDRREAYRIYLNEDDSKRANRWITLRQAQKEFMSYVETDLSRSSYDLYKNLFSQVNKFFTDRRISDMSPRDIDLYKAHRIRTVSPSSINMDLRHLRAFFNRLVLWKYLDENPCNGIKEIRTAEATRPFLSKEDLHKLLDHTRGTELHDIILFGAMTGLRKGEILNLTWRDVDLERGTIIVQSSVSYHVKGGKLRMVPLNSTVKKLLEDMPRISVHVFPGDRGGKYNIDFVSKRFKRAVLDCELNPALHFHSLRHTFASLLVQDGVPLYHIQKLLGHSSARVTEIYAHLGHGELFGSVERLASVVSSGSKSRGQLSLA